MNHPRAFQPRVWTGWRGPLALAAIAVLALLLVWRFRPGLDRFWGDEPTFVAMAESMAYDGDLRFDGRDLGRLGPVGEARGTVILHRTEGGFFYSKPVLYAVLAAPFTLLLGTYGPVLLNCVAWLGALLLAYAFLQRLGPPTGARWTLVTLGCSGVVLPQLVWRMSDAVQMALGVAGMVLAFAGDYAAPPRESRLQRWVGSRWAPYLGAAILGLLTSMRLPNGILAIAPPAAMLLRGRWRRSLGLALAAALGFALITQLSSALVDTPNPYRAHRSSFSPEAGYPVGPQAARGLRHLEQRVSTNRLPAVPQPDRRSAYAMLYFWIGRHSGLLFYLPFSLLVVLEAAPRLNRQRAVALGAFFGLATFYALWQPDNTFGGGTFLGNRYILPAYGALLLALPRLPSLRRLAALWIWSAAVLLSGVTSLRLAASIDPTSQSHAHASLLRLAPYESVASNIDGRRDRYWSGDFLRFVDPFADARDWSFVLDSASPTAEILLATTRPATHRLMVQTDAPDAELIVREGLRRRVYSVAPRRGNEARIVDLELGWPWRQHQFWWDAEAIYGAHSLRLDLVIPAGSRATATLRYLGAARELEDAAFRRKVLSVDLPRQANVDTVTAVRLRLRNQSPIPWLVKGVLPTRLTYRMTHLSTGEVAEGHHQPLPEDVLPGHGVRATLRIRWPPAPGRYRVEVDLLREHVAWFGERVGSPLASRLVQVVAEGAVGP